MAQVPVAGLLQTLAAGYQGHLQGKQMRQEREDANLLQALSVLQQGRQIEDQQRQREQGALDDERRSLSALDPNTPQYAQALEALNGRGRELAGRPYQNNFQALQIPRTPLGKQLGPLLQRMGQPAPPSLPGVSQTSPETARPSVMVGGVAVPVRPNAEAIQDLLGSLGRIETEASATGDAETANRALSLKQGLRAGKLTPEQAQQEIGLLDRGAGQAKAFLQRYTAAAVDLDTWLKGGRITDPVALKRANQLAARFRKMPAPMTPAEREQGLRILEEMGALQEEGAVGEDPNSAALRDYRKGAAEARSEAEDLKKETAAYRQNQGLLTRIVQVRNNPQQFLALIDQQREHAKRNEAYGLTAYGDDDLDPAPRPVVRARVTSPQDAARQQALQATLGSIGDLGTERLAGAPALEEEQFETPEEVQARRLQAAARYIEDPKAKGQLERKALDSLLGVFKSDRWDRMSEGERSDFLKQAADLSERLGLPSILPPGVKGDRLTPHEQALLKERQDDRKSRETLAGNRIASQEGLAADRLGLARERIQAAQQRTQEIARLPPAVKERLSLTRGQIGRLEGQINDIQRQMLGGMIDAKKGQAQIDDLITNHLDKLYERHANELEDALAGQALAPAPTGGVQGLMDEVSSGAHLQPAGPPTPKSIVRRPQPKNPQEARGMFIGSLQQQVNKATGRLYTRQEAEALASQMKWR